MVALLVIALCWAFLDWGMVAQQQAIPIKKH